MGAASKRQIDVALVCPRQRNLSWDLGRVVALQQPVDVQADMCLPPLEPMDSPAALTGSIRVAVDACDALLLPENAVL